MREVLDNLKCDVYNGEKCYCMTSEEMLNAMKELAKKEERELQKYKNIVDTILEFGIFMDECPLNFSFDENSIQDKAQNVFYSDNGEFCENNCNGCYKKCWVKYFEEIQRLKEIK